MRTRAALRTERRAGRGAERSASKARRSRGGLGASGGSAPARERVQVALVDRSRGAAPGAREVARLLQGAGRCVGAPSGEVAVLFTGDEEIRGLNHRFRGRNRATDVLAFPDGRGPAAEARRIGDIVISIPAARRNAREARLTLAIELRRLLIHGFLHLLGYDHEVDGGEMADLERELHARLLPASRRSPAT